MEKKYEKPDIVFPKELRGEFTDSDKKQIKNCLIGMLIGMVIMGTSLYNSYAGTDVESFNEMEVYNKNETAVLTDSAATENFNNRDDENDYYGEEDWDEEDDSYDEEDWDQEEFEWYGLYEGLANKNIVMSVSNSDMDEYLILISQDDENIGSYFWSLNGTIAYEGRNSLSFTGYESEPYSDENGNLKDKIINDSVEGMLEYIGNQKVNAVFYQPDGTKKVVTFKQIPDSEGYETESEILTVTEGTEEEEETLSRSEYEVVILDCTWEEAQVDAENRGGHLVVITSEEEQKEIEALIGQNGNLHTIWLGGRMEGDKIEWINGEESSYTKWAPNEPNNETGDEKYLDMYEKDGLWLWNDVPNDIKKYYSGRMGYVLEKEIER